MSRWAAGPDLRIMRFTRDPGPNLMETMISPVPILSPLQCPSALCQMQTCHLVLLLQGRRRQALPRFFARR